MDLPKTLFFEAGRISLGSINSDIATKFIQLMMIDQLRKKYRPQEIRLLLVAESPPDCDGGEFRFFYSPVMRIDNLYRYVMKEIFPDFDPSSEQKAQWLERFRDEGCYLIDATDNPINSMSRRERRCKILESRPAKLEEIKSIAIGNIPIILIKTNVFDLLGPPLREAGLNVANQEALPFPSSGHQKKFQEKFRECLDHIGFQVAQTRRG